VPLRDGATTGETGYVNRLNENQDAMFHDFFLLQSQPASDFDN
jgi:hypothetical protein